MKRIALILIPALLIMPLAAQAGRGKRGNGTCSLSRLLNELPQEHLRNKEVADLLYMREEEKLARDVYLSLYEKWDLRAFRQIAKAEKNHMGAALVVIDKYQLVDPVADNALGVFTHPELQALYRDLSAAGTASQVAALQVGAAIEELDIWDLQRSLERANNEDLQLLYQNLMKGSRNHLRAFVRLLERHRARYTPVYLTPDEYREIVESPREKGVLGVSGEPFCGRGRS